VKPIAAELVFDGSRLVFTYSGEGKIEVRRLQEELSRRLRRRVELRSVGPREQSRLCGGYGLCGTQLCCTRFPSHEQPIALRMAKDQDLPLSSGRITGLCGRLRCCLAYEHPMYRSFRDRAPRVGSRVETPEGIGLVKSYEVLKDSCVVALESERVLEVKIDDCRELETPSSGRR
jgi:cell fate regulator YaaT (PSP1 superfamily)